MLNNFNRRRFHAASALLAGAVLTLCVSPVAAQAFPDRPLRMVVPFPPGASTDTVARLIAKTMSDSVGQTIVVDNRAGAGGTIGAREVARAAPDGHTLLFTTAGIHIANPVFYKDLPYEPVKSWAPVGLVSAAPMVIVVQASSPFKTVQDLLDHARKNPGELTYASAGVGSSLHQWAEIFKEATDVNIRHIPYGGGAPAVVDFLAGRTDMMFTYYSAMLEHTRAGKTRMLAVASPERLDSTPDVPTLNEVLPDLNSDSYTTWSGVVAPAGTPAPIVERLSKAVSDAVEQNRDNLRASGFIVLGGSSQDMLTRMTEEFATQTPQLARLVADPDEKK